MSAQCDMQTAFSFRHDREIRLDFEGGEITSDAGLIALREFDQRIGFTQGIVGYEDQNDAQRLRHDGLFQLIAGKPQLGEELGSESSLSRLENAVSPREVGALDDLLTDSFIRSQHRPPVLILEGDSTDDPCHGQQQLIAFNGFHNQYMYHPLLIHEGQTGCLLGTFLRPGNAHAAEDVLSALEPIVMRLKAAFPHTILELRADAGFAVPRLYEFCERHKIGFTIAIGANEVVKNQAETLMQQAVKQYHDTGEKARPYAQFAHRAKTWSHPLRMLIKAEAGPEGTNLRFVVTNRPGDPQRLFGFYEGAARLRTILYQGTQEPTQSRPAVMSPLRSQCLPSGAARPDLPAHRPVPRVPQRPAPALRPDPNTDPVHSHWHPTTSSPAPPHQSKPASRTQPPSLCIGRASTGPAPERRSVPVRTWPR